KRPNRLCDLALYSLTYPPCLSTSNNYLLLQPFENGWKQPVKPLSGCPHFPHTPAAVCPGPQHQAGYRQPLFWPALMPTQSLPEVYPSANSLANLPRFSPLLSTLI